MRFTTHVVTFKLGDIPMIGNLRNGFTIGLTTEGSSLCQRIKAESIEPEEARRKDPMLFDCLRDNGFFSDVTEKDQLTSAYLHVTQRCNLNCRGCYSLDNSRNSLPDSSTAQMKRAIDELGKTGCRRLFISGGEPFLRSDLPEIIQHAKIRGIKHITLITNGTCVHKDALVKMAPFVDVVAVSFDGYDNDAPAHIRGEQRFERLVEAIRLIQETGIHAHLIPTIHSQNIQDLQSYADLAESLGTTMNYSLLSCTYEDASLKDLIPKDEELELLGSSLLGMGTPPSFSGMPFGANLNVGLNCGAGVKEVSVGADGTVYPCHMLHQAEWSLGNIFSEQLESILDSKQARLFRSLSVEQFDECQTCNYKFLCSGGCRARSQFRYGDLHHKDAYCAMSQSYYDALGMTLSQRTTS